MSVTVSGIAESNGLMELYLVFHVVIPWLGIDTDAVDCEGVLPRRGVGDKSKKQAGIEHMRPHGGTSVQLLGSRA